MRISVEEWYYMAKTIFGTTEKSNFILNMDLDWYRKKCVSLILLILWATACSAGINQLTDAANTSLNESVRSGGIGALFALLLVGLRSVATVFSVGGVLALIFAVIGLMRQQWTKRTGVLYGITGVSLVWAIISMVFAYDYSTAVFGLDGRDEGWIALLMYGGLFFLGTMLRQKGNREKFFNGILLFGIVQCLWGILQALPFLDYLNPNKGLNPYRNSDPLLIWNIRLPSGLTDSPITFAMLLAMLLAVSIPAAIMAESKKTRIRGTVCAVLSMMIVFKTQTIAGLAAGFGAVLFMILVLIVGRKSVKGGRIAVPLVVLISAGMSVGWVYMTPSVNHVYYRPQKQSIQAPEDGLAMNAWETDNGDSELPNSLYFPQVNDQTKEKKLPALYDGGIIWDDGFYRLSTAGPYLREESEFNIYDAASALAYANEKGWAAVKIDPLFGVGPDNMHFTQLHKNMVISSHKNLVDRPYNDLIYIAATRGIPSLVLHVVLLALCAVFAWRNRKRMPGWMFAASLGAVVLYTVASMFGISVLTVAPLFWVMLGVLAGEPLENAASEKTAETKSEK